MPAREPRSRDPRDAIFSRRFSVAPPGPRRSIVYGTDVPFNWPVTVDLVLNASFLSDADKTAILGGNLQRLLRIA